MRDYCLAIITRSAITSQVRSSFYFTGNGPGVSPLVKMQKRSAGRRTMLKPAFADAGAAPCAFGRLLRDWRGAR
jgi:hypothetical protein